MDENQILEELVRQTIEGAIQSIPAHLYEVEASKEILKGDRSKRVCIWTCSRHGPRHGNSSGYYPQARDSNNRGSDAN